MRLACLLFLAFRVGNVVGQVPGRKEAVVDVAPEPSQRFPAAWYPPENDYTSTNAPVKGAPFRGVMMMLLERKVPGGGTVSGESPTWMMRDSAGRTRSEESLGASAPGSAAWKGPRQIEVNDFVRHCSFRWVEPARDKSSEVATVSCLSRRLSWVDDGMEAKMTKQTPDLIQERFATYQMEPLGSKEVAGVRALGIRQTKTPLDKDGNAAGQLVLDMWWSPELKELLEMKPLGDGHGVPGFAMQDLKRTEPDASLFYPPAGWKITKANEGSR